MLEQQKDKQEGQSRRQSWRRLSILSDPLESSKSLSIAIVGDFSVEGGRKPYLDHNKVQCNMNRFPLLTE